MLNGTSARLGLLALAMTGLWVGAGLWGLVGEKHAAAPPARERAPASQPKTAEEVAYYEKFAEYRRARGAFDEEVVAYWDRIKDKRQARRKKRADGQALALADYELDQPPVYRGPSAPAPPLSPVKPPRPPEAKPDVKPEAKRDVKSEAKPDAKSEAKPDAKSEAKPDVKSEAKPDVKSEAKPDVKSEAKPDVKPEVRPLPVVADFLRHARTHFTFTPDRPQAEADFKRAYAQAALKAGISRDQAVRIYGFEATGNGRHDVQAGLESPGANRRAISTALGYNQLLVTNTISLLAEHGGRFLAALNDRLATLPPDRRKRLAEKIDGLRRMVRFTHCVPRQWGIQDKLARGPRGQSVHALNLDVDIGPLLQAQKLADSVVFARRKGYGERLTAAELEMMNLMGDGSGFDVVSMPEAFRDKVPTSNMFQRGGYDRNPVVRKNNTVAALLSATDAKMDQQTALPGAKELEAAFNAVSQRGAGAEPRPKQKAPAGIREARD